MAVPRIYVGTYGKYNNGSIDGAWLELDDFERQADFMAAAYDLHDDEHDPELMFQDWECIPDAFISESSIDPEFWEYMEAEGDEDAKRLFVENFGRWDSEAFEDSYQGYHGDSLNPRQDFAQELADGIGLLSEAPDELARYFDWESWTRDLFLGDYWEEEGHIFRNV